jgi:hypothetical protein
MKTNLLSVVVLAGVVFLGVQTGQSAVAVQGYWRLGEDDSTQVGSVGITNSNATSTIPFTMESSNALTPTYSTNVASGSVNPTGSTTSVLFSNAFNGYIAHQNFNTTPYTFSDNFGMEIWVNPGATSVASGFHTIFANSGDPGTGVELVLTGGTFYGLLGGVSFVGGTTATAGNWFHLAIVRDTATFGTRFYVNGVQSGSDVISGINTPGNGSDDQINIGSGRYLSNAFDGYVDEARIFTFASGAFGPSDLLVVPEPSTYAMLALGAAVLLILRARRAKA